MQEQTIRVPPRTTAFTEICESCEREDRDRGGLPATVSGHLRLEDAAGWATCRRGHVVRVLRLHRTVPAGSLR